MIQSWKTRRRREIERRRRRSFGPVPINDSHTLFGNYPLTSTGIRVDNYSADCNYVFRRAIEIIAQNMAKISRHWRLKQTDAAGKRTNYTGIHHRLLTRQANNYTFGLQLLGAAGIVGQGLGQRLRLDPPPQQPGSGVALPAAPLPRLAPPGPRGGPRKPLGTDLSD